MRGDHSDLRGATAKNGIAANIKVMRTLLDREITKGGIWADKFGLFAEWRFWEHCSG